MLAAFVLFLREGLEASLIVSILLAALRQLGQTRQMRAVWIGAGLAIAGSLAGAAIIYTTIRVYDDTTFQTIFETGAYLVAVALLTYMTFWMQQHSRTLKKELTAKASAAGSGFAFGLLAFSTVGREGLETAVFMLAIAFQTSPGWLLLGAALGLLAAVALCFALFRLGYRLDYRVFFRVVGALLLFFAAGLLGDAVQNLQALQWLPIGTAHLWDTSGFLSEDSTLGDLLHTFLGYSATPSVLQALTYLVYLLTAGGLFIRASRKPGAPQARKEVSALTAPQA
ncbi:MAG TPA: FTR1 family protein [Ktedonobacterales bacterium]|nr:FTR1 family protein [Ktedonobacterales bacterium]